MQKVIMRITSYNTLITMENANKVINALENAYEIEGYGDNRTFSNKAISISLETISEKELTDMKRREVLVS